MLLMSRILGRLRPLQGCGPYGPEILRNKLLDNVDNKSNF